VTSNGHKTRDNDELAKSSETSVLLSCPRKRVSSYLRLLWTPASAGVTAIC